MGFHPFFKYYFPSHVGSKWMSVFEIPSYSIRLLCRLKRWCFKLDKDK
ncbi:hypothetical protein NC653_007358 [Populus alba x Populus x berolinensis]|nr:hypothetical protein NC653_007358 [Populus alba x Populus x berolinensis]